MEESVKMEQIAVDITDQVVARKVAEEGENYFRGVANTVPVIIWMSDKSGTCTYLNERWYTTTGQSVAEAQGTGWAAAIHPDDQRMAANHFLAANLQRIPFKMVFRLRRKCGGFIWVMGSGEPRRNLKGDFDGYAGTVIDIHEQVLTNERFQLISKATQDAIWDWDLVTNAVWWNNAFYSMFHYTSEDVEPYGDWWLAHIHPDDRERIATHIHAAIDGGETVWANEYRFEARDGSYKTVYDRGFILHDSQGRPVRMLGSMQDVTQQKMAVEVVAESEKKFRQQFYELENIYRNAPIGLALIGKDGSYLRVNERLAEMNGLSVEAHVNRSFRDILPDHAAAGEALIKKVVESKEALLNVELRGETLADPGVVHIWNESWYPIINSEGEVESVSVVVEDVTASRQAEEALRESESRFRVLADSLELQVAGRTRELQRSNQDLQQFAHVASHDLKEPVRKILIFGNRVKEELPSLSQEKLLEYISKIESAAHRMYSMINGVLLYSTINAAGQEAERVDVNLAIRGISSDLEITITEKKARIVYHDLPPVKGSSVLVFQLFYNLISNALKFSRDGIPPVIEIEQAALFPGELEEQHLQQNKGFVKLQVKDNGIGFRDSEKVVIFEAFLRLHSKDKYEGSGLGLSLCKKIAERHGGAIKASGAEEQGAVFTVILPAWDEV